MIKSLRTVGSFSVVLGVLAGCADDSSQANSLLVETNKLVSEADRAFDVRKRVELLSRADQNLRKIVDEYSGTPAAVELSTGQSIGNISRTEISERKSRAERDLFVEICSENPSAQCVATQIVNEIADARKEILKITSVPFQDDSTVLQEAAQRYERDLRPLNEQIKAMNSALRWIAVAQAGAKIFDKAMFVSMKRWDTEEYVLMLLGNP